jgi:hypothetical protein
VDSGRGDGQPFSDLPRGEEPHAAHGTCRAMQHGCSKRSGEPCDRMGRLDRLRPRRLNAYEGLRRAANVWTETAPSLGEGRGEGATWTRVPGTLPSRASGAPDSRVPPFTPRLLPWVLPLGAHRGRGDTFEVRRHAAAPRSRPCPPL